MNYNDTLKYIHSLGRFSLPAGTERINAVMQSLGNPQNSYPSIHIAGTNGKGSVSAMTANIFKTAGFKTGLFISPYIINFRERIQINGEFISESDLVRYSEKIMKLNVKLTEFEFITAIAFLYFKEMNCDIVVSETGLGGRFDATNSLSNTLATVITKIGLDHSAILGDTVEKIAAEKCGIIKKSPVTVSSPSQRSNAFDVIEKYANRLVCPDIKDLEILEKDIKGTHIIYKGKEYRISLLGDYQIENALTAIETVANSGLNIPYEAAKTAIANTFFPARAELISENPIVLLDGAHNPDGAAALEKIMKNHSKKITAIIGVMKDKDYNEVLKITLSHCKNAVAVSVEGMPRSLSATELCDTAKHYCPAVTAEGYTEAVKKAVEISEGEPIFVFGSLYLASGIRNTLINFFE